VTELERETELILYLTKTGGESVIRVAAIEQEDEVVDEEEVARVLDGEAEPSILGEMLGRCMHDLNENVRVLEVKRGERNEKCALAVEDRDERAMMMAVGMLNGDFEKHAVVVAGMAAKRVDWLTSVVAATV